MIAVSLVAFASEWVTCLSMLTVRLLGRHASTLEEGLVDGLPWGKLMSRYRPSTLGDTGGCHGSSGTVNGST